MSQLITTFVGGDIRKLATVRYHFGSGHWSQDSGTAGSRRWYVNTTTLDANRFSLPENFDVLITNISMSERGLPTYGNGGTITAGTFYSGIATDLSVWDRYTPAGGVFDSTKIGDNGAERNMIVGIADYSTSGPSSAALGNGGSSEGSWCVCYVPAVFAAAPSIQSINPKQNSNATSGYRPLAVDMNAAGYVNFARTATVSALTAPIIPCFLPRNNLAVYIQFDTLLADPDLIVGRPATQFIVDVYASALKAGM